jgi:hypothetical protein
MVRKGVTLLFAKALKIRTHKTAVPGKIRLDDKERFDRHHTEAKVPLASPGRSINELADTRQQLGRCDPE